MPNITRTLELTNARELGSSRYGCLENSRGDEPPGVRIPLPPPQSEFDSGPSADLLTATGVCLTAKLALLPNSRESPVSNSPGERLSLGRGRLGTVKTPDRSLVLEPAALAPHVDGWASRGVGDR
jgi:hypothetical protein